MTEGKKKLHFTKSWGLSTKLIIAMTVLSLASLIVLAITVNIIATKELERQIAENLINRADLEANHIGDLLAEQVKLVQAVVASDPEILATIVDINSTYEGTNQDIETQLLQLDEEWRSAKDNTLPLIDKTINNPIADQLRLFIRQFPAHAEIFITDQFGGEIAGSGQTSDYFQADEDWWQAGWNDGQGQVSFGSPEVDESANLIAIDIIVPVFHPETREVIGIVKTVYDISALIQEIDTFRFGNTGGAQVYDNMGHFIAGVNHGSTGLETLEHNHTNEEILKGQGVNFNTTDLNNNRLVIGHAQIYTTRNIPEVSQLGWTVHVGQHQSEAFAPVNQVQLAAGLLTIIAGFITATVVFFISRAMTQNLLRLTQVSRLFGEGKLDSRMEIDSQDEIGQLAYTFNQMATSIQERIEETETARQQAERSDQVKSAFLASMSHELRTPLNAVINFSQIIANGVLGSVNEKQVDTLNKVILSGKHLLSLINDVLDMSKIEADSLKLFVEDNVDINQIVLSVTANAESLILDSNVDLITELTDSVPKIRGDRKRITQVVTNIVSNACKFTEEGTVKISTHQGDQEVVIVVEDTGHGIDIEDYEQVFVAFMQTNKGLRQGDGTGLGLPISKNLVLAHGGRLWFESEIGIGTTFFIALPIAPAHMEVTLI